MLLLCGSLCAAQFGSVAAAEVTATAPNDARLIAALERCAARLDAERDVGVERILRSCSELDSLWSDPATARWLPTGWREAGGDLSAGSLRELAALLRDAAQARAAGAPLADAALRAALDDVARDADDEPGVLQRLLRWIRALVSSERDADPSRDLLDWLDPGLRWQRFWTVIGWLSFGIVIALAAWVVRNELRAAGWPGVARRARAGRLDIAVGGPTDLADAAAAPLHERPGRLLRSVAAELEARGRLARAAAATTRQILQACPVDDPAERGWLLQLGRAADAVRYAPVPPDAATLEGASEAGAALLAALRAASPAPAAST